MKLASNLPILDARKLGAKCDECPFHKCDPAHPDTASIPVPPTVVKDAEAIILAESPGYTEVQERRPLCGQSGQLLDRLLDVTGWRRSALHLTNTVLCRPPNTASPADWKKARAACEPRLKRELKKTKAKTVLAFGKHAMIATIGKQKVFDWMGAPFDGIGLFENYKVLPSFHFAHGLRYPEWIPVLHMFMFRGKALAQGTLPEWKWPNIIVSEREGDKAVQKALRAILNPSPAGKAASVTLPFTGEVVKKGWDCATSQFGLGVDVETAGIDPLEHALLNVGIACVELDLAVSVNWQECSDLTKQLVKKILASRWPKTLHNGQFDVLSLESNGLKLENYDFDTLHAHAVVAPRLRHKLDVVGSIEFHAPKWKAEFRQTTDKAGTNRFVQADPIERAVYNAQDCWITALLRPRLWGRIKRRVFKGEGQFADLMFLNTVAYEARRYGLPVDRDKFAFHDKTLLRRRRDVRKRINDLARAHGCSYVKTPKGEKKPFNPGSSFHIRALFIDHLGVQPRSYSQKTGLAQFREKDLQDLAAAASPAVRRAARDVILFRRWTKYLKTYVRGMPIGSDGRVHASPNPSGARTGRWSYQDPNLQNIPKPVIVKMRNGKDKLEAPGLRELFRASKGKILVELDYKQLEAYVLGILSGDVKLLEMLKGDIHTETAKILFGARFEKADDKQRKRMRELAKRARYAMHYGAQPTTAWAALVVDFPDLSITDVKRLWLTFEKLHPQIVAWQKAQLESAYKNDFVEAPISGRRYHFHGFVEPTKCYNLPIQMTAADLINKALIRIWPRLNRKFDMILIQIHDALIGETTKKRLRKFIQILKEEMEREVELNNVRCIFPVDIKTGVNWGGLEEWKEQKAA